LAADALKQTYDDGSVIVLSYNYGPPLVPRGFSFEGWKKAHDDKDCSLYIDGACWNGKGRMLGAGWNGAPALYYDRARPFADERIQVAPAAHLTLSASMQGGRVDARVSVDSLTGGTAGRRVHVLLVEDSVPSLGVYRLRSIRYVVRSIAGDSATGFGLRLGESERSVSHTFDLAEITKELLARNGPEWEHMNAALVKKGVPVPRGIYTLDTRKLYVVAFIQDDRTGEILDAVSAELSSRQSTETR
jgi:hypothetical protein